MNEPQSVPENQTGPLPQYNTLCIECQTGVMHMQYITYFTWLNEELVTVPNFPAWVCDVCGRREYDNRAIAWLNTLLNPETGRRQLLRKRRKSRANRKSNRLQP
jgi:YgiT-type zinc finger domain-containing protein